VIKSGSSTRIETVPPHISKLLKTSTYEEIRKLETTLPDEYPVLDIDSLTNHYFTDGLYVRQMEIPVGTLLVGKIHSTENMFFLAKGELTLWGVRGGGRVKAPFMAVTKPGDKRVGFAHEDCIVLNFIPNPDNERDTAILEDRITIKEEVLK